MITLVTTKMAEYIIWFTL